MDAHTSVVSITCMLMLTMLVQTYTSDSMEERLRNAFLRGFATILFCALLDWTRVELNGSQLVPVWLHGAVVSLEYTLAPVVVLFLIGVMGAIERNSFLVPLLAFNGLLQFTSGFTEWIFYIDAANNFVRGEWFRVHVLIYSIGIFVMYWEVYRCSWIYQNRNGWMLFMSILSLTIGVGENEFGGECHTTFLAVSIAATMFYVYFMDIGIQTDPMTKLLNRRCYDSHLKKIDCPTAVVMFDVDKFKYINDTYGHEKGDIVLQHVAICLRRTFGRLGYLYRLGGDEFCLILRKGYLDKVDFGLLRRALDRHLEMYRRHEPLMPAVSMGHAIYDGGLSVQNVVKQADQQMYADKKGRS
ncbi:GGDEF domain-containing protein [Anaerovibrio slackiae]|uniref:GGDEF domain-containing protein n=1 Tax=Anaerovibrio slackiae TaxID=2652309 RepID=UPI003867BCAD